MTTPYDSPRIELRPLVAALRRGQASELTVLVRLHAPEPVVAATIRPPLNLALVIDRSGSMTGEPLEMARQAACAAVRQLRAQDRLSIVTFDNTVQVVIPSQYVTDPAAMLAAIGNIESGGSTALHAGWLEGASQVAGHLQPQALNRVILLTDGQANVGLQRAGQIAPQVQGLAERGVSTSAIGLGDHYDEDLLVAIVNAGDGNFEHAQRPAQLPSFFELELQGLGLTTGRTVSLGLEPNPEYGVRLTDMLNDLPLNDLGRLKLPNLMQGQVIDVVVRLRVPATPHTGAVGVMRLRLAWNDAHSRHRLRQQLDLPVLDQAAYAALESDPEVQQVIDMLEVARLKRRSVEALDRGDHLGAQQALGQATAQMRSAPASPARLSELSDLESLSQGLETGEVAALRKRAVSQSYNTSRSKPRR